ncbi:Exosome complex component RRP41 [Smittium culicis]|uniref:Ribosomal RNA-processing protein 41 n=1 Tax=Smittium culicis TaxID=133412 RepID=A0A1R1YLM5_9FUNG|nr:Exosome complex component RRP41 [Smittium culicis]
MNYADGSSYYEQGNTKVLVGVFGPRESKQKGQVQTTEAGLVVEIGVSPFSTNERKKRSKNDKRLLELSSLIKQTFDPIIFKALYPRSSIDIYIQVLQVDGGLLSASINATCLAIINAGIPMIDYVVATTAGFVSGTDFGNENGGVAILDLNGIEESSSFDNSVPSLTVAILPRSKKLALVQMESKLSIDKLNFIMDMAINGTSVVHSKLDETIKNISQ